MDDVANRIAALSAEWRLGLRYAPDPPAARWSAEPTMVTGLAPTAASQMRRSAAVPAARAGRIDREWPHHERQSADQQSAAMASPGGTVYRLRHATPRSRQHQRLGCVPPRQRPPFSALCSRARPYRLAWRGKRRSGRMWHSVAGLPIHCKRRRRRLSWLDSGHHADRSPTVNLARARAG